LAVIVVEYLLLNFGLGMSQVGSVMH